MKVWAADAVWQNFSSMYREAITAQDAKTGMEQSHHLTASLYFAIATLEAFLNRKFSEHQSTSMTEEEVFKHLRNTRFMEKVRKWPTLVLEDKFSIADETVALIDFFNDVRGALTHPKSFDYSHYEQLESVNPKDVRSAVAEFISQFHKGEATYFPYWLWGWNYLNPRSNEHDIIPVNDQQFMWSLQALGFRFPGGGGAATGLEPFRRSYMSDYKGYREVGDLLDSLSLCEPKASRFPFQPKLCRRWWTEEHHRTCGHVTTEAIERAIMIDRPR